MTQLAKTLVITGAVLLIVGVALLVLPKIPYLGKLPGDIYVRRERFSFYFPLATCLMVSVIISFILWLFRSK